MKLLFDIKSCIISELWPVTITISEIPTVIEFCIICSSKVLLNTSINIFGKPFDIDDILDPLPAAMITSFN